MVNLHHRAYRRAKIVGVRSLHHLNFRSLPVWHSSVPSLVTLGDSATPYSKCATPYTIGLSRKVKSCDQKHGCLLKICGFQDCNCMVSRCATPYSCSPGNHKSSAGSHVFDHMTLLSLINQ